MNFSHDRCGGGIGQVDCPPVVGLGPGIFSRELVKAAAVDADYNEGVGKKAVW